MNVEVDVDDDDTNDKDDDDSNSGEISDTHTFQEFPLTQVEPGSEKDLCAPDSQTENVGR